MSNYDFLLNNHGDITFESSTQEEQERFRSVVHQIQV